MYVLCISSYAPLVPGIAINMQEDKWIQTSQQVIPPTLVDILTSTIICNGIGALNLLDAQRMQAADKRSAIAAESSLLFEKYDGEWKRKSKGWEEGGGVHWYRKVYHPTHLWWSEWRVFRRTSRLRLQPSDLTC